MKSPIPAATLLAATLALAPACKSVDVAAGVDGAVRDLGPLEAAAGEVPGGPDAATPRLQTVFVIVMENKNWVQIAGSPEAPYINGTLVPSGAFAAQYFNPPHLHPSEPNYIWMEAGDSLGIADNNGPQVNSVATTDHLVTYLTRAGISWKGYAEDIDGVSCPLVDVAEYAPKHNPFVFFKDLTGNGNAADPSCIAHLRPFSELAADLRANRVARYNFILPNLCHSMHNCGVASGDGWLRDTLPALIESEAYRSGGVVFLTWEEGEGGTDGPIGMLALSPRARSGQASQIHHDHSSLLKTVQEIFAVTPLLRHAGDPDTTDLAELFLTFP
jgi:hypothetical protein